MPIVGGSVLELAFLGPAGTFSEEAARRYCSRITGHTGCQMVPVKSLHELLTTIDNGTYQRGIVPVENSIEGPVVLTLDMLVHEVDLQIIGEEVLPVQHHLLARPGIKMNQIERILSHPQALGQCRQTLSRLVPNAEFAAASSTAEAARLVAAGSENWAAIGTPLAAQLYGLSTLAHQIQDVRENSTRFLVVAKEATERTGYDKTSAAFAFGEDRPGNLFAALRKFAERGINLTKLESRPAKRSLGDYIFFIDMEGHRKDARVHDALVALEEMCTFFRLLGSYPRTAYPRANGDAASEGALKL